MGSSLARSIISHGNCLFSRELEESFCLQSTWFSSYFGGLIFGRTCILGMGAEEKDVSGWRVLGGREERTLERVGKRRGRPPERESKEAELGWAAGNDMF